MTAAPFQTDFFLQFSRGTCPGPTRLVVLQFSAVARTAVNPSDVDRHQSTRDPSACS